MLPVATTIRINILHAFFSRHQFSKPSLLDNEMLWAETLSKKTASRPTEFLLFSFFNAWVLDITIVIRQRNV